MCEGDVFAEFTDEQLEKAVTALGHPGVRCILMNLAPMNEVAANAIRLAAGLSKRGPQSSPQKSATSP